MEHSASQTRMNALMAAVDTRLILDPHGDLTVHSYQDVEDIIEHTKALRSVPQRSDWGRHVASIPLNVINQWLVEEWARGNANARFGSKEFDALIARKLRDHDWLFLRTG
jgi:hypothetical protein